MIYSLTGELVHTDADTAVIECVHYIKKACRRDPREALYLPLRP